MSLSRRGLFRGAAALGVTAASGGTGKIVQGAVATAGGSAGLMAAGNSVYGLLKSSGIKFPHEIIKALETSVGLGKRANADGTSARKSWHESLLSGEFGRYDHVADYNNGLQSNEYSGKIDFEREANILKSLKNLPSNIPLLDLLSDATYQDLLQNELGQDESASDSRFVNPFTLKVLRRQLEPICDGSTTAQDLIGNLEGYFLKLARHAISHPGDFASRATNREGIGVVFRSSITDLKFILKKTGLDSDEVDILVADIDRTLHEFKKQKLPDHINAMRFKAKEQAAYEAEASNNVAQKTYSVTILSRSETEFVVDPRNTKIPSRKDWFNWMRSIDPEDAKICDIKTSHGGLAITFQNQIAIDYLNARTDETHLAIVLDVPNSSQEPLL